MYRQPQTMYGSNDSVRRLSSNNPFRQGLQELAEDRTASTIITSRGASGSSSGTPTHLAFQNTSSTSALGRRSSPSNFDDWVQKNKQLINMLSDDEDDSTNQHNDYAHRGSYDHRESTASTGAYDSESDLFALYGGKSLSTVNSPIKTGFAPPSRPQQPLRSGSDSQINFDSRPVSSNNPFASALQSSATQTSNTARSSRSGAVPPPRPPKDPSMAVPPPPSYEEAAGREKARAAYRDEKLSGSSSPTLSEHHRPRRANSDGAARSTSENQRSYVERSERDKDRPRRHHTSSHRHREKLDSKGRSSSSSKKKKEPIPVKAKNLDTIDKLDVTAFFGGGFHHDGPFDACTPHRNKNKSRAPVMAFPVDGPNNSIKGLGGYNNSKTEQMNLAFGKYDADAEEDEKSKPIVIHKTISPTAGNYTTMKPPPSILANTNNKNTPSPYNSAPPSVINFDSNVKSEPIHGIVTGGLGSSTFIDGAPAPKSVQEEQAFMNSSGLGRKKSIVQRLRKNSSTTTSPPASHAALHEDELLPPSHHHQELGRRNSADARTDTTNASGGNSFLRRVKSLKVRR